MPSSPSKTAVIATSTVVAVLVVAALAWWLTRPSGTPAATATATASSVPTPTPRPSGTTPAPVPTQAAEPTVPVIEGAPEPPDPALSSVEVVTTFAAWNAVNASVEVGAYAATVESGGRCTLVLTGAGTTVSTGSGTLMDASTTSCDGLAVPSARLSSGAWQAVVVYESATSAGTSQPVTLEVP